MMSLIQTGLSHIRNWDQRKSYVAGKDSHYDGKCVRKKSKHYFKKNIMTDGGINTFYIFRCASISWIHVGE